MYLMDAGLSPATDSGPAIPHNNIRAAITL
jgi:hypothetical protein